VANGPLAEDHLQHLRASAGPHWNATLVVEPQSLGIVGALRRGLDLARSEYVLPVDADDELTPDALQVLANQIDQLDHPDLVYSDEDALVNGVPAAPYLRAPFDPILNLESSYIWHLFAIRRETALGLGVYTDSRMDFCQDWDTVTRVANAGGRIEHVPEVLYHWRHHALSSTNKPSGDPRSLVSVRHLLEGQIGVRVARPHHFSVAPWPIDRGAPELYIARSDSDLPRFAWIGEATAAWLSDDKNKDAILVLTVGAATLTGDGAFIEAARLFDLHPRLGALGGRVLDPNGIVLDACFVKNEAGKLESPWVGHHVDDMGPYAMASKPQSVATTGRFMAFLRVRALREASHLVPEDSSLWPLWILNACAKLAVANWTVAYSPLLLSRTGTPAAGAALQKSVAAARSVPMHATARYGSLCPHDFHWRAHSPMSYPKRRTEPVAGKPQRIAVIYLNRHAEGERPVRRFIESYKANAGGIDHEFITIYKGFPERRLAHARRAFTEIETRHIAVDDDMTDIDAYLLAAQAFPDVDIFSFVNTFSEIACKDWLLHLHTALSRSDVGIAGASGSFESLVNSLRLTGKVIWLCTKGYLKYDHGLFSQYRSYIGALWALMSRIKAIVPVGRLRGEDYRVLGKYDAEFEEYWAHLTSPKGIFSYLDGYPSFPNPNIRTNAFMIRRRQLLSFVPSSQRMKKHESYLFESGANSLTRFILDQGLRAMVVNCDGEMYDVEEWPRSRTFRLGDQAGLLVRDNQTRRYDRLAPAQKRLIAYMTWGTAAGYSPADVYTFGIHFDGTPLRYQARVNE
jgi:hypothetical protein